MKIPRYQILCVLWLVATCLAGGCAHQENATKEKKPVLDKPLSQAEMDAMIKQKAVSDPFLRSQVDFGLVAHLAAPDHVQATVTNKTDQPVVVGPRCFGLIVPGRREKIDSGGASLKLFPVAKVLAGAQASGELVFPVSPIPAGARLVFYVPGRAPAMAQIR